MADFFKSRLFWISLGVVVVASTLPLYVSGYILGLLTVAYYFGVFAMAWDLLFGFAGEVNFGPTFLIGVGAYAAGILNTQYGWSVYLYIVLGSLAPGEAIQISDTTTVRLILSVVYHSGKTIYPYTEFSDDEDGGLRITRSNADNAAADVDLSGATGDNESMSFTVSDERVPDDMSSGTFYVRGGG